MGFTETSVKLTDDGVFNLLQAAIAAAKAMGQPQCIAIVDGSGVELASFRMTGSRYLSIKSALAKAHTAASIGAASNSVPEHARLLLAAATKGGSNRLAGRTTHPHRRRPPRRHRRWFGLGRTGRRRGKSGPCSNRRCSLTSLASTFR